MSPEHIAHTRRQILIVLEDVCSVNTRLREMESGQAFGDEVDEIADWMENGAEHLGKLAAFVRSNKP